MPNVDVTSLPPMVPPATVGSTPVSSGASVTGHVDSVVAAATGLRYFGFSAVEDAGGTASFRIQNNVNHGTGVNTVEYVSLAPGESCDEWYGPDGLDAAAGISVYWVSGSFKLSVRSKVVT